MGGGVGGGGLGARPRRVSINSTIVPLWMFRRSVGVGTPPGGPGREAEEFLSCGAAYGAHTIAHRQREGDVFHTITANCTDVHACPGWSPASNNPHNYVLIYT